MGSGKAGCRDRLPGSCAGGNVPPKSLARDVAFAKLQSRILAAVEAVQAAKLHSDMPPDQQAIMLSAGGPGTCWTAMHKSPTELAQNARWRKATALRLSATPDAAPRSTCALRKGNDGDMCEQSLAEHPFHPLCCKYGEQGQTALCSPVKTSHRLIEQAGSYADMERHVLELYDWVKKQQRRGTREAVRHLRCETPGSRASCNNSG